MNNEHIIKLQKHEYKITIYNVPQSDGSVYRYWSIRQDGKEIYCSLFSSIGRTTHAVPKTILRNAYSLFNAAQTV
jgi:hypothetical protein